MYLHTFVSKLMGFLTPTIQEPCQSPEKKLPCWWESVAEKHKAASRRPLGLVSGQAGGKRKRR